ncbi:MAG: phenylalanine--tRNA ligase subunit beta [Gammaproteobacteria bacterium]|nr:phenylalanine--tRNA ligase subunit beta [Gammaproteobacteria bacterium]
MKISEQWLRAWVNPAISTAEMCDQLTMAGLEIDSVEPVAGAFNNVVVARVVSLEKHPDADKLNVCQVTDGKETLQIVCGASNVRAGLVIPLAKIGAELPGAGENEIFKIKPAKLRGVESSGMLCSEKELGLAEQADGLMELSEDAPIGADIREYLGLDDNCIEIDLTPNRGDCLSIAGVARELGALNQCQVTAEACAPVAASSDASFPVEILATEACSHYVGRVVTGINCAAKTPVWMLERLRRSGIRGLGPVVDITNYVMLELGQPMHAFDLATLTGGIQVRFAKKNEKITLLDGKCIELDEETLLIADHAKALALAGVMGGEGSGVSDATTSIFLESAFFKPENIAGKARGYGLHTDSSHRFERGVDPQLQVRAIERATELVLAICGGEAGAVIEKTTEAYSTAGQAIHLRQARIERLLGIKMQADEVEAILNRLEMKVKAVDDGWQVTPPSFRFDIAIEADLLEELVRIYGYNNIPRTQPDYQGQMKAQTEYEVSTSVLRSTLVDRGYFEAITYSFIDPKSQKILDPESEAVKLANPISSEMSVMRTSLWPGLIQAVRHNLNRQHNRVRLFETGLCFRPGKDKALDQVNMIAGAICGDLLPEQWSVSPQKVDFFDLKADVEALLAHTGEVCIFAAATHPALHPGQSASISIDGEFAGWIGALHPEVMKQLDLDKTIYVFELRLDIVKSAVLPAFSSLSRFPEVRRDLAVVIDKSVTVQSILVCIGEAASDLLRNIQVFDIYTGKGIDSGRKSVALGLILQDFSRTLTDQDVETEVEKVVSSLKQKFAATLRE